MPDSDKTEPVTQEWTIYVCPKCGTMDPSQYTRDPDEPRHCMFSYRGLSRGGVTLHPYSTDQDYPDMVEYAPVVVVPKESG